MKNIVFVPAVAATEWVRGLLPEMTQTELPLAGRRFIDYAIEQAQNGDFAIAEILDWHWSQTLADEFSDLTHSNIPVLYQEGKGEIPRGLDDLKGQASPLTQDIDDGLYVVWGLHIMKVGGNPPKLVEATPGECANTPIGAYTRVGGKWMKAVCENDMTLDGIKAWYAANFTILHEPETYTLPGYSAEADVHIGRNVVMEHGTDVKPPVIIDDNAWCARNVVLDGDVIVGGDSFISEGATLRRTVVGDNTYIGAGLELVDKIVIGKRIIDVQTGVWTDVEEPGVARSIGGGWGWLRRIVDFFRGASRGRAS